jgi:hypothetical protein
MSNMPSLKNLAALITICLVPDAMEPQHVLDNEDNEVDWNWPAGLLKDRASAKSAALWILIHQPEVRPLVDVYLLRVKTLVFPSSGIPPSRSTGVSTLKAIKPVDGIDGAVETEVVDGDGKSVPEQDTGDIDMKEADPDDEHKKDTDYVDEDDEDGSDPGSDAIH